MEAKSRPTKQQLDTAILRDARDFAALEEEWAELYEHCPSATPFQSWAWLYSWWESYGGGYELRLTTFRDVEGLLVGILPLMLERRFGYRRLLLVGTGETDFLDVLVREGWEEAVARAGAEALRGIGSWVVVDLQELRPRAAAWDVLRDWAGPRAYLWQSNCPVIDVKPWDELLMSLTKNRRKSARRALRQTEKDGLRTELVDAEDAEDAARRLVALHQEAWHGRGIGLEHTTRRFEALLEAAACRIIARGLGAISEYRRDGEVVISSFFVFGRDFVGTYLTGASQESLNRYQVSSLCKWDVLNIAHDKNLPRLNHLRGEEPHKLRWSSKVVPNHRLILGRNPTVLATYTGYHLLRSKAEVYALSENAPRWSRRIASGYRALRLKAARRVRRRSE